MTTLEEQLVILLNLNKDELKLIMDIARTDD